MSSTRTARRWLACAALAAAPLLGACGDANEPRTVAADAPPIDACALMTEDEAIRLAEQDLDPVSTAVDRRVDRETAKCSYANLGGPPFRMISLEARRYPSPAAAARAHKMTLKLLRRTEQEHAEDIVGMGESALWAGKNQQVHVLQGDLRLIVTVQLGDPRFRGEAAREIAGRALQRLAGVEPAPAPGVVPAPAEPRTGEPASPPATPPAGAPATG